MGLRAMTLCLLAIVPRTCLIVVGTAKSEKAQNAMQQIDAETYNYKQNNKRQYNE